MAQKAWLQPISATVTSGRVPSQGELGILSPTTVGLREVKSPGCLNAVPSLPSSHHHRRGLLNLSRNPMFPLAFP